MRPRLSAESKFWLRPKLRIPRLGSKQIVVQKPLSQHTKRLRELGRDRCPKSSGISKLIPNRYYLYNKPL
eukprot:130903-Rhodomonas_salina.2